MIWKSFNNLLYLIAALIGLPFFVFKMLTAGKYRRGLGQRFGFGLPKPSGGKPTIWVHAVSVGELHLSKVLVDRLQVEYPDHQIVITYTTRTGEGIAAKIYPDLARSYSPLDFSFCVARFFKTFRPELLVLIELELWPNFLLEAKKRQVPVFLANGRISARSASGYGRNAWFFKHPFSAVTCAAVQNPEYDARLKELFAQMKLPTERVTIAGNLKFDNIATGVDPEMRNSYRKLFGVSENELVLVCGSTHPSEPEIFARLYKRLRDAQIPLRIVIAPRHPERYKNVREIWKAESLPLLDRSTLNENTPPSQPTDQPYPACILLDTMGELAKVYHCADIVFVGGSLNSHGGQNMAEPAGIGLPVIVGPNTANFPQVVRDLLAADALIQVQDADQLHQQMLALCGDAQRRNELAENAMRMVESSKGSVDKHLELIKELLPAKD